MKTQKIKRYRLGVSRTFPATHPRKGEQTYFMQKIYAGLGKVGIPKEMLPIKLHTIRSNYPLWEKRMKEVQTGNAVIELFYWSGKPRNKGSQQVVFATLDKDSGCGVQKLHTHSCGIEHGMAVEWYELNMEMLAKNDGLSLQDFKDWFKSYDLSHPMAILHFTSFRY